MTSPPSALTMPDPAVAFWGLCIAGSTIPTLLELVSGWKLSAGKKEAEKCEGFMRYHYSKQDQWNLGAHVWMTLLVGLWTALFVFLQDTFAVGHPVLMNVCIVVLCALSARILRQEKVDEKRIEKLYIAALLMLVMNWERIEGYQPHKFFSPLEYVMPTLFVANILWATYNEMRTAVEQDVPDVSGICNALGGVIFLIIFCCFYETYEVQAGVHSFPFHPDPRCHWMMVLLYSYWNFCFAYSMHSHEPGPFTHSIHLVVPLLASVGAPSSWLYYRIMAFGFWCFLKAIGRYNDTWNNYVCGEVLGFTKASKTKYLMEIATLFIGLGVMYVCFNTGCPEPVMLLKEMNVEEMTAKELMQTAMLSLSSAMERVTSQF